ncbi:hypothetical protein [Aeromonas cavernicola]|uniref:Uncharacterized protein n=1 Tax=Aeromonas cavernicola TaxID=1006623 RepID=A0A2H9U8V2_9GAMM|nr:hypothetical protein [Aeromonas cavernicola]PJG60441.1 hypothetical protein CUC53_02010 [Aeromonas cavernicola]
MELQDAPVLRYLGHLSQPDAPTLINLDWFLQHQDAAGLMSQPEPPADQGCAASTAATLPSIKGRLKL